MRSMLWIGLMGTLIFLLTACGDASLEGYLPKDQNEAGIKALLLKYKYAIDNDDMDNLLSCFDKNCKYMHPTGKMITKLELMKELPDWLRRWDRVDISKVQIDLKEDTASVTVKEKIHFHGHELLGMNLKGITYFELMRENDDWYILDLTRA